MYIYIYIWGPPNQITTKSYKKNSKFDFRKGISITDADMLVC